MHRRTTVRHVPGWSTLGDQIGPVDIRGARPLHSGCCEAVLECAPHAVDSRIFGSKTFLYKKRNTIYLSYFSFSTCCFCFCFKTNLTANGLPPELRWQSGRLLTDRSLVRSQVVALYFFYFFYLQLPDPLRNVDNAGLKLRHTFSLQPCSAEVSSDRTNLSPFTKDYRGLALQCD